MSGPISVPAFSLIASYTALGDVTLPSSATLTVAPGGSLASGQALTLIWNTFNVAQIKIANAGDTFDTGIINNPSGNGSLLVPGGFSSTQVLTLFGFDINGNSIILAPLPTYTVIISGAITEGQWLFNQSIRSGEILTCGVF